MLTPAEELGLSGLHLDGRLRKAVYGLPDDKIVELTRRMTEEAFRRQLIYTHHGQTEAIRVMLRPLAVMPDQLAYLHFVSLTIMNALKRIAELYLQDAEVRETVPLSAAEEQWLRDTWGASQHETNPVFGRLDAMAEFTSPTWKESLRFFEPNLCGVGGIHLGPTCEQMLMEIVVPELTATIRQCMGAGPGPARAVHPGSARPFGSHRPPRANFCSSSRSTRTGPSEQAPLAQYFHEPTA